jgi:hypothetical protein
MGGDKINNIPTSSYSSEDPAERWVFLANSHELLYGPILMVWSWMLVSPIRGSNHNPGGWHSTQLCGYRTGWFGITSNPGRIE